MSRRCSQKLRHFRRLYAQLESGKATSRACWLRRVSNAMGAHLEISFTHWSPRPTGPCPRSPAQGDAVRQIEQAGMRRRACGLCTSQCRSRASRCIAARRRQIDLSARCWEKSASFFELNKEDRCAERLIVAEIIAPTARKVSRRLAGRPYGCWRARVLWCLATGGGIVSRAFDLDLILSSHSTPVAQGRAGRAHAPCAARATCGRGRDRSAMAELRNIPGEPRAAVRTGFGGGDTGGLKRQTIRFGLNDDGGAGASRRSAMFARADRATRRPIF